MAPQTLNLQEKYKLKTYKSFEEAVDGPKDRKLAAKTDNIEIEGNSIVDYYYNGSEVAFILSNKKVLLLNLSDKNVRWNLLDQASFDFSKKSLPDHFVLVFPKGTRVEWKWKEILDKVVGKLIKAIAPSDVFLWLYVEGCDGLMFNGFTISEENRDLLHFDID